MKIRVFTMLRFSFFLIVVWYAFAATAQTAVVTVGWDDYPPYQISDQGNRKGIDMDIATQALRATGYEPHFKKLPWARQLLLLEKGELDIAMSASLSDERTKYADWTIPYREERVALMSLASRKDTIKTLSELIGRPVRIGIIRGSDFGGEYARLRSNAEFQKLLDPININLQNVEKLRRERIDYLIDDPVTIQFLASRQPGPPLRVVFDIVNDKAHFMISKRFLATQPNFLEHLNTALRSMDKKGTIKAVFASYGN